VGPAEVVALAVIASLLLFRPRGGAVLLFLLRLRLVLSHVLAIINEYKSSVGLFRVRGGDALFEGVLLEVFPLALLPHEFPSLLDAGVAQAEDAAHEDGGQHEHQ
jgi:hypothetical protein